MFVRVGICLLAHQNSNIFTAPTDSPRQFFKILLPKNYYLVAGHYNPSYRFFIIFPTTSILALEKQVVYKKARKMSDVATQIISEETPLSRSRTSTPSTPLSDVATQTLSSETSSSRSRTSTPSTPLCDVATQTLSSETSSSRSRSSNHPTIPPMGPPWVNMGAFFRARYTPKITFVIGVEAIELKMHYSYMEVRSPELKKVVEGATNSTIKLKDWDPKVFACFLEYLYTDDFPQQLDDFKEDEILQLINLGYKFCPQELDVIYGKVGTGLVNLRNAFRLNQFAMHWKLTALKDEAMTFIDRVNKDAETFIQTDEFLQFDMVTLCEMIKADNFRCSEVKLFEAVVRWGRNQLDNPEAAGILREQLAVVINFIRFPLMSLEQIAKIVIPTGVLTAEEGCNLLCSKIDNDKPQIKFSSKPRENPDTGEDEGQFGQCRETETVPQQQYLCYQELSDIHVEGDSDVRLDDHSWYSCQEGSLCSPSLEGSRFPINIPAQSWEEFLETIKRRNCNDRSIIAMIKSNTPQLIILREEIAMNNLEKVVLQVDMSPVDQDSSMNCDDASAIDGSISMIKQLRSDFDLEPFVFFKKTNRIEDPLWDPNSKMEFELEINGVKFFKLSREEKEITIGFGGNASSQLIPLLAKIEGQFQKLILVDCPMPAEPILDCSTFQELMLWGVRDTTPSNLGIFLRKFAKLQKLTCWTKRGKREDGIPDKSSINIVTDLVSGKELTKMAVCYGKLILHSSKKWVAARKENLAELYTNYCHWSPEIFKNFHKLFPNLKKVNFGCYCGHPFSEQIPIENTKRSSLAKRANIVKEQDLVSFATVRLMTNLLKIKSLNWIRVWVLDWIEQPCKEAERKKLEKFLTKAGLPFDDCNFLLEKDEKGKWTGKSYGQEPTGDTDSPYWEEMDLLEYEHFGLSRIFRDYQTYDDYHVDSEHVNP